MKFTVELQPDYVLVGPWLGTGAKASCQYGVHAHDVPRQLGERGPNHDGHICLARNPTAKACVLSRGALQQCRYCTPCALSHLFTPTPRRGRTIFFS